MVILLPSGRLHTPFAPADPGQLDGILTTLKQQIGTNTLRGQRPENMFVVVSLKQQLMQLADRTAFPAGLKTSSGLTAVRA